MSERRGFRGLATYAGLREKIEKSGIESALNSARVCSYRGVELFYCARECAKITDNAQKIRDALTASETDIACISCYLDVVADTAPYAKNEEDVENVKRCIDLAAAIGSPFVHHTLVTRLYGGRDNYDAVLREVLAVAGEIADYAMARGITVLYEPQGMLFNGLAGYSLFFDAMRHEHENVGVCLDVGNPLWVDEDCYALAEKYAPYVKHVHLKDYVLGESATGSKLCTLGGTPIREVRLGTGIVDVERVLDILKHSGYDGYLSIEDNSTADYEDTAKNAHTLLATRYITA
jgi:sugar phosphate isomerase/epimerase